MFTLFDREAKGKEWEEKNEKNVNIDWNSF